MTPLFSNYVRRKRFEAIEPFLKGDVLDLGCGVGDTLKYLQSDQEYMGVEGNPAIYSSLITKYPHHNFINTDLETDILEPKRKFDTILMMAIIEHLVVPANILSQTPMLLKTDGQVVITTPSPFGGLIHLLGSKIGIFYKEASDEHKAFYNRNTIQPILNHCGLEILLYRRFLYGGNQLFVCRKLL